jgi:2-polyprenyl-3-methyl-5-hydroxy-6-metoxy-1,4-benzoquinol methylase
VQQRSYVTYTFSDVSGSANCGLDAVTLLESGSVFAASGITGFRTWEAAPRFGSFLCSENGINYVRGKQVLELGAGTGLVAILCAKILGASYVLATDGSDTVIETLEENLFLNGLDDKRSIDTRILKWGQHFEDDENDKERKFDVVLGADLVSSRTNVSSGEQPILTSSRPTILHSFRLLYQPSGFSWH